MEANKKKSKKKQTVIRDRGKIGSWDIDGTSFKRKGHCDIGQIGKSKVQRKSQTGVL